jgi:hypothetical protein
MEEKDSGENLENKGHRDRNLEIYFEIFEINKLSSQPSPSVRFKSSNYELSRDEKMRATLRPNCLILDDKVAYNKTNEKAYFNNNGENILQINYCMLNRR